MILIIIYMIILIFLFLCLLFFFINKLLITKYSKKIKMEFFNKNADGSICSTDREICYMNQNGISNCCTGFTCIRPNGQFENKICVDNKYLKNNINQASIESKFKNFINNIFTSKNHPENNQHHYEFCEEEELKLKMKDICGNPYKLNFDGLLTFCKLKLPNPPDWTKLKDIFYSNSYNDKKNCLI